MSDARDKHVNAQVREMVTSMHKEKMPKGVTMSTIIMSTPLFLMTGYLTMMAPMALNPEFVDPNTFAYMCRTALRLLSLNISFLGGIHYGFASAIYESSTNEEEKSRAKYQIAYSFVPAILSFASSSVLLFAYPLTIKHVIFGFTSLMMTQLINFQVDKKCVEMGMAPKWFAKYRGYVFAAYMACTTIIFTVYYSRVGILQRRNDPNRIENIKTAMELEDADFIEMVDELKIDYDATDLREMEQDVTSQMKT
jgi:hypothetical protein